MTQHVTPRAITLAAGLSAAALALTGCGASSDPAADADVTPASSFTMVAPTSGSGATPAERIAADYQAATGVTIEVTAVPADSYDSTVKTQLQGGSGADLLTVTGGNLFPTSVGPLVEAGLIEPVDVDAAAGLVTDQTKALFTGEDGELYAQPTGTVVYGLITNDATLVGDFPTDFDDVLANCTATQGSPAFLGIAGSASSSTSIVVAEIAANEVYAADPDWNAKRAAGEVTFADSPEWQKVFADVEAMVDAGCFADGAAGAAFPDMVGGLMQGASQTVALPSLLVAELAGQAGDDVTLPLSVNAFPADGDGLLVAQPGAGLAVNAAADASTKAAVREFLTWLAEPENNATFAEYEGSIPAASLGDATQIPTAYASVADKLAAGEYIYLPSGDWTNPAVSAAMGDGMTAIITGQGDGAAALKAMDAAWG